MRGNDDDVREDRETLVREEDSSDEEKAEERVADDSTLDVTDDKDDEEAGNVQQTLSIVPEQMFPSCDPPEEAHRPMDISCVGALQQPEGEGGDGDEGLGAGDGAGGDAPGGDGGDGGLLAGGEGELPPGPPLHPGS